jgi:hypothetical protein
MLGIHPFMCPTSLSCLTGLAKNYYSLQLKNKCIKALHMILILKAEAYFDRHFTNNLVIIQRVFPAKKVKKKKSKAV